MIYFPHQKPENTENVFQTDNFPKTNTKIGVWYKKYSSLIPLETPHERPKKVTAHAMQ